jgi:CHASE2 domain-containing sensor protein
MLKKQLRPHLPVIAGGAMLALCLVAALVMPRAWSETIRENAFDLVLVADEYLRRATDDGGDQGVVVIDIDRRSIEALGSWPWPRETMAELVEAIAAEKPAAIALDILFAEPDSPRPRHWHAALAPSRAASIWTLSRKSCRTATNVSRRPRKGLRPCSGSCSIPSRRRPFPPCPL